VRNIPQTTKRRKANWISHILGRNCLIKYIIERKIEGRIEAREDKEEDVSSYWLTIMKRVYTGN